MQVTAGRLRLFKDNWEKLTDDKFILNCIQGYKIQFLENPVQGQKVPFKPLLKGSQTMSDVKRSIENLLSIGAIRCCKPCDNQFISSYFLVEKANKEFRFVLNLKKLNKFIQANHFKMEDGRTAAKLLAEGDFMANIDLENAYFLVPIHIDSSRYLRFIFEGKIFEFTCLPFGLNVAPLIFTKIMKPVVNNLRRKGLRSVIYLDDLFCIGSSKQRCAENVSTSVSMLESLGFIINYKKSNLTPSKEGKFLGIIYNSEKMILQLPEEKKQKMLTLLDTFSTKKGCTIRQWASFVGSVNASCTAAKYGRLHTRDFEKLRYKNLLENENNFDAHIRLPESLKYEFHWWKKTIPHTEKPIILSNYRREIFTDASLTGWGASCGEARAHGFWNETEASYHINHLELIAIFMALKCFAKDLRDCSILLRVDNTTAVAYINKMGGIQHDHLNKVARDIWNWCESRNLWIFASYIRSAENVDADAESRIRNIDTEWELSNDAFRSATAKLGLPSVDLFASRCNTKCSRFFAWKNDPEAVAVDAFTRNWFSEGFFWAFPPFSLILRTLQKIRSDRATGIMVVPNWPNQPWFPVFSKLVVDQIVFEPSPDLLMSPCRSIQHPLAKSLRLIVAKLSGTR